jgi:UDP-N-acetylglucosamine--N-acetylmuramyl-(pentapeptide) pyrophosphoryl-undecaprenol N-acetylglucosamine transferase
MAASQTISDALAYDALPYDDELPYDALGPVSWLRPGPTLLVASTGGHLDQLYRLHQAFEPQLDDVEWVTFDTAQSRDLLAGQTVHFVPFVEPKDLHGTGTSAAAAVRLLRARRFARVISTGAAVAVPFLATARSMHVAAHYIESAARSTGPSLSGQLVSHLPGVRLYAQYAAWTAGRWQYRGTVFDGFAPARQARQPAAPIRRVVVTFGTQRRFGFRRAAERLARLLPEVCAPDAEILWQTGPTDVTGLGIPAVTSVPAADLRAAVADADLVVCHAGIGSALLALEQGRCPVLLPRRHVYAEHTDDHQVQIATELRRRRLAVSTDVPRLTAEDLLRAARTTAVRAGHVPSFVLQPD